MTTIFTESIGTFCVEMRTGFPSCMIKPKSAMRLKVPCTFTSNLSINPLKINNNLWAQNCDVLADWLWTSNEYTSLSQDIYVYICNRQCSTMSKTVSSFVIFLIMNMILKSVNNKWLCTILYYFLWPGTACLTFFFCHRFWTKAPVFSSETTSSHGIWVIVSACTSLTSYWPIALPMRFILLIFLTLLFKFVS